MNVSNSSTLILLAKVSLLDKYLESYGTIHITEIVLKEVQSKKSFENLLVEKEFEKGNIIVKDVSEKEYLYFMQCFGIAEGEASTFALAKENDLILSDDKKLINLCKIERKSFTSSMAVVVKMFEEKLINKQTALEKLKMLFGYGRYSNDLYDYFKKQVI